MLEALEANTFGFGDVTLETRIDGIFGPDGQRYGYVVSWEDVRQQRQIEELVGSPAADLAQAASHTEGSSAELRDLVT